jgi:hypothetical protein
MDESDFLLFALGVALEVLPSDTSTMGFRKEGCSKEAILARPGGHQDGAPGVTGGFCVTVPGGDAAMLALGATRDPALGLPRVLPHASS